MKRVITIELPRFRPANVSVHERVSIILWENAFLAGMKRMIDPSGKLRRASV